MRTAPTVRIAIGLAAVAVGVGCSAAPKQPARSHAELTRESQMARDEAVFAVGDALGARLVRTPEAEIDAAPIFARRTEIGFQAADALGAAGLSSRPTLATVLDDE